MSAKPARPALPIIAPTVEAWRAMSADERERFLVRVLNAKADRDDAELAQVATRAEQAMTALRATLIALFEARDIPCPDAARARVAACDDPLTLQRWILRATTASSAEEALSAPPGE